MLLLQMIKSKPRDWLIQIGSNLLVSAVQPIFGIQRLSK